MLSCSLFKMLAPARRTAMFAGLIAIIPAGWDHRPPVQTISGAYHLAAEIQEVPGQPYVRHSTKDRFGRRITFYLSNQSDSSAKLPLIVYIQGSGCNSLFARNGSVIVPVSGHATVSDVWTGHGRVLIAEKPGVEFLNAPRDGCLKQTEFNQQHSLERWSEAVEAAIRAARTLPNVNENKLLLIGHSEGGVVAARIARKMGATVTHIAILAGEGPTQLYSLIQLAREGVLFRRISSDPEERVQYVLQRWREIQADPTNTERNFFGFSYLRWHSFLSSSPIEELEPVNARIHISHGTADRSVSVSSSDVLYVQLLADGKEVTFDRVEGADHSFNLEGDAQRDGWNEQHEKILTWFSLSP